MSGKRAAGDDKDTTVAKTAGFIVFSGIAMSVLKALSPYNEQNNNNQNEADSPTESIPPIKESHSRPPQEAIITKPIACADQTTPQSSPRTVEIVRGDTLWGLSRKYGVSIDAIKEANGLSGNTIYAGKKLIIP